MSNVRLRFRELASRITGVSIPLFGVSWTPPESEREAVRDLFAFLEDRRALYADFASELEPEVTQSVLAIRAELTAALRRLPEGSEAVDSLKAMRAACRDYLDRSRMGSRMNPRSYLMELGRLRALVGVHLSYLAVKFGLDIEGDLTGVIPAEFRDASYLDT